MCAIALLTAVMGCSDNGRTEFARRVDSDSTGSPFPDTFGFGRSASPHEIAAVDIDVLPDGTGLPLGSGRVAAGEVIYAAKCAACHGAEGEGSTANALVGRQPDDAFPFAEDQEAPRVIGSYWPYATTIFDYVRRSMPYDRPGSLTDDEVYSLTAFLLFKNEIITEDAVMSAETLPKVRMPARDRYVPDDRLEHQVVH